MLADNLAGNFVASINRLLWWRLSKSRSVAGLSAPNSGRITDKSTVRDRLEICQTVSL